MPTPTHPRSIKRQILLVEDSEDDAYFFRRTLKKTCLDWELEHVLNGAGAIKFLTPGAAGSPLPGIIFLDLKMPIVSGFDLLEWIGRECRCETMSIVVLSGSNDAADRKRASDLGAADYLVKPITPEELSKHLNTLCSADQERAQSIEF